MNIVICGSREFTNYQEFCFRLAGAHEIDRQDTIISGGAKGVDELAERYAHEHGNEFLKVEADWKKHKRAAGMIRNVEMAANADIVIAFWNRESKGTKHMIEHCQKQEIEHVILFV